MRPLRIYLLVNHGPADWEITTHQNVKSLLDAWNGERSKTRQCGGLVHVGFDRPETAVVSELTAMYPQRVLVSASARWALPSGFRFSKEPVGSCEGPENTGQIPVFLGLSGWGYEIEDHQAPKNDNQLSDVQLICQQPNDRWLLALEAQDPRLCRQLIAHGIDSDEKYLALREKLSRELAASVDLKRFSFLRQLANEDDPIDLLKIAPLSALESPIERLTVSVRVANALKAAEIRTLRDIRDRGPVGLGRLPNLGLKSLTDLSKAVFTYVESLVPVENIVPKGGPKKAASEQEETLARARHEMEIISSTSAGSLFALVSAAISALPENKRLILWCRLAMDGRRYTLEEIAKKLGLTRERVRQIESRSIAKILETSLWANAIALKAEALLLDRRDPLYLDLLEAEDTWFSGFSDNLAFLASVIEAFTENRFKVISIDGRDVISRISKDDWDNLKSEAKAAIRDTVAQRWTENEVNLLVEAIARDKNAPELTSTLVKSLLPEMHFTDVQNGSERVLVAFGRGVDQIVAAILEESDAPLHYLEIFRRVQHRAGREIDLRRVHNACKSCGGKLFGRGTYGLLKHCPMSGEEAEDVLSEVHEIILSHSNEKQWHCAELIDILSEKRPDLPENLNRYILSMIMERSEHLTYLGRLVWAVRQGHNGVQIDRIDMVQACVVLLKQAGHPLSAEELKKRLSKIRGVNPALQIHQNEQLFLVAPNIWGLVERDIPISQQEREALLDRLYAILKERGKALHISEVTSALSKTGHVVLEQVTPYLLLSLANRDARFHLAKGQLLGLSGWASLGRIGLPQATREVINAMTDPLSFHEIHTRVESLVERSVDALSVSNLLRASGLVFDSDISLWKLGGQQTDEEDEKEEGT